MMKFSNAYGIVQRAMRSTDNFDSYKILDNEIRLYKHHKLKLGFCYDESDGLIHFFHDCGRYYSMTLEKFNNLFGYPPKV